MLKYTHTCTHTCTCTCICYIMELSNHDTNEDTIKQDTTCSSDMSTIGEVPF